MSELGSEVHNAIASGELEIAGGKIRYQGFNFPQELIYGPLPEGAAYYEVRDLNGDGDREVFAATTNPDGTETIIDVRTIGTEGVSTTGYSDWASENIKSEEEPETETEDPSAISDENAISAAIEAVPDKLKGLITEKNIMTVLEAVIDDPMTKIKKNMGAGVEIELFKDWRTWKVFGPLAIPGVPLPPGIIDVTLGTIAEAVENVGDNVKDGVTSIGDFVKGVLEGDITIQDIYNGVVEKAKQVKVGSVVDPWGGTVGGFGGWVRSVLGGVLGGQILIGIYDDVKDLINPEDLGLPIPGGTEDDEDTTEDLFLSQLDTVENFLEVDPDLTGNVDIGGDTTVGGDTTRTINQGADPDVIIPDADGGYGDLIGGDDDDDNITTRTVNQGAAPDPIIPDPSREIGGGDDDDDDDNGGSNVNATVDPDLDDVDLNINGGGSSLDNGGSVIDIGGGLNEDPDPDEPGGIIDGGGGGGGGGGGNGMFTGDVRGLSYMPQQLPGVRKPPPLDAISSLNTLIDGLLTGRRA